MKKYEIVIGIETHVQLKTKSKLFCGCSNDSREAEPNTKVCPVCLGLPGTLPVLNAAAVALGLRTGLALHGEIGAETKFDRKNYFYPDLPKGYQISQYDKPIIGRGFLEVPLDGELRRVGITRAHLEEDAGKLTHPTGADYSLVDLNRAGTPLLEIVSEPDMRSAAEAKAYATELFNVVRYAGVSDADLYYGNMRFDVNVSVRPEGQAEFGTRAEVKNLNSFRAIERAVEYEAARQIEQLESGGRIKQETRGWDEDKGVTYSMRSKEDADEYRYFPEPDLPPLIITKDMLKVAADSLGLQPAEARAELAAVGLGSKELEALVAQPELAKFALAAKAKSPKHARFAANWLLGEELRIRGEAPEAAGEFALDPETINTVAQMVKDQKLSSTNAKALLLQLRITNEDPEECARRLGLLQVSDTGELEVHIDKVLALNPAVVDDYRAGKVAVLGFLVGQVMKESRGQANPQMVNELLRKKIGG